MVATSRLAALALCAVLAVFAADISGRWIGSMPSGSSNGSSTATVYLHLRQQADTVAGTLAYQDETKQVPIENPELKGDQLTFEVHDNPRRIVKFRFTVLQTRLDGEGTSGDRVVKVRFNRP
jgi:hypothetical protein